MNITEMREIFDCFAKTSFMEMNGDNSLVGHNVSIQWVDNTWDIYFHRTAPYRSKNYSEATLGTGKLNNLIRLVPEINFPVKLDGEGWFQTPNTDWLKDWLFENRKALGLSKRRPPPKVSIQERVKA